MAAAHPREPEGEGPLLEARRRRARASDFIDGIVLEDTRDKKRSTLPVKGLFIAIGHTPLTGFLKGQITTDDKGYVKLADPWRTTTNVEGVFAAGDVADSTYRQAVTAAGMGCKAALDAERWLAAQGIH